MDDYTKMSFEERQQGAEKLLQYFSQFTNYQHGDNNLYRRWLNDVKTIEHEKAISFLCQWYQISRRQSQILLLCASSFPNHAEQDEIHDNYGEEAGVLHKGDMPHYRFLELMIEKLGGKLMIDKKAEQMNLDFFDMLRDMKMTEAEAIGALAAIEHPALDISAYLHRIVELCGRADLMKTDFYLMVHVDVEPIHILLAHGKALKYMEKSEKDRQEVIGAFRRVMDFWQGFWPFAFSTLGYPTQPLLPESEYVEFGRPAKW
jgi:hypothetical protein